MARYRVLMDERVCTTYVVEADTEEGAVEQVRRGNWLAYEGNEFIEMLEPHEVECIEEEQEEQGLQEDLPD